MTGQEQLPLMVKLFVVVSEVGQFRSPFTPRDYHENVAKYEDYYADDPEQDVERVLSTYLEDAAELLAGLGIRLDLHPDGVIYIQSEDWFGVDLADVPDVVSFGWEQGQSWVNLYFVSALIGETVVGATIIAGMDAYGGGRPYGIVLRGSRAVGPVIAHEIGHMLGLPHTFIKKTGSGVEDWEPEDDAFSALVMAPFEDDTVAFNTEKELIANPMSDEWDIDDYLYMKKYSMGDFCWTSNQVLRAQTTLLSRRSNYAYYINDGEYNEEYPPMPDFCPTLAAAWMG